jgi:DnaJ-class molecular chaperone
MCERGQVDESGQKCHEGPGNIMADPYGVLGLPVGAAAADVKQAFRKLALQHHPDRCPPISPGICSIYCS